MTQKSKIHGGCKLRNNAREIYSFPRKKNAKSNKCEIIYLMKKSTMMTKMATKTTMKYNISTEFSA